MAVFGCMGYLKGTSSAVLYEKFGERKCKCRSREFWWEVNRNYPRLGRGIFIYCLLPVPERAWEGGPEDRKMAENAAGERRKETWLTESGCP